MHHMRTWVQRDSAEAWTDLLALMSDDDRDVLLGLVPVGWYDLALQHRLLRAIDANMGSDDGELAEVIGRFEAEQDLTVVHRLFLRLANPAFVLEKAGDYWNRFYDVGVWDVRRESKSRAVGRLEGVTPFDPLFARYLTAYIIRMWELVGAKDLDVKSRLEGESFHIQGSWR